MAYNSTQARNGTERKRDLIFDILNIVYQVDALFEELHSVTAGVTVSER